MKVVHVPQKTILDTTEVVDDPLANGRFELTYSEVAGKRDFNLKCLCSDCKALKKRHRKVLYPDHPKPSDEKVVIRTNYRHLIYRRPVGFVVHPPGVLLWTRPPPAEERKDLITRVVASTGLFNTVAGIVADYSLLYCVTEKSLLDWIRTYLRYFGPLNESSFIEMTQIVAGDHGYFDVAWRMAQISVNVNF